MEQVVRMSAAEYERFQDFRGAEKTVASIRTQMRIAHDACAQLARAVQDALDARVDGTDARIVDSAAAYRALTLSAEVLV